jgi:hypothetical protein
MLDIPPVCGEIPYAASKNQLVEVANLDITHYEQNYLEVIDAFNRRWQGYFPGVVIDTSTDESVQSGQQSAIKQLAEPASLGHNVNDICRRLGETLA